MGGESVANQAKMETDQTEAKTEAATVSPFTATEAESAAAGRYVGEVIHDSDMKARIPGLFTLLRCGCCELCALRFLGQRVFSLYREPLPVLRCIMESLWATLPETERRSDGSDWRARSQATEAAACVACLGTLQNVQSDKFMGPLLAALTGGTGKYEFSDYSLTITMPASTVTRQYALHYHLLATHKFTEEFEDKSTIVDIKEAMKWILGHELRRRIGLNFSRESLFHVGIKYKHAETETEHHFLYDIEQSGMRPQRKKKQQQHRGRQRAAPLEGHEEASKRDESDEASLTAVTKTLRNLPMTTFIKYGAVPPVPINEGAKCELTFFHDSIYLAGRYAKFSRELSQSPWVADGARVSESSVQELITGPLNKHFQAEEMRFSSSGREDIDVRMLAEGRPFVLEVVDPHRTKFTPAQYMEMQREINESTHLVRIRDLQRITKDKSTAVQAGEEDKKKTYRCVVWLAKAITPDDLLPLQSMKDLVIDQTTPIRVLHRRTLMVRKRTIYAMRAQYISPHFITLDLTTQAGTYVKEFVHGDLGRTTPNLGLLLGCETDILQLDVLAIELDFPPRLPGQPPIEDVFASTAEKEKQPADETVTTEEGEQQKRKEADKPKEASV